MKTAKKIVLILLCLTLLGALSNIVSNIVASCNQTVSFPWWDAFGVAAFIYGPILVVELVALGGLVILEACIHGAAKAVEKLKEN